MFIVCLDLEGVLVPEIWINVSRFTGIDELKLTTRDIPDYDELMKRRLSLLKEHNLTLAEIAGVINRMDPLPGAGKFLSALREKTQVIILSDTFTQFAAPLMKKLSWPTLFCNQLIVNDEGRIVDYVLRQAEGKAKAVGAFQSMGFQVFAAGDSYNDLGMIRRAERGALFCAPPAIIKDNRDIPAVQDYPQLAALIDQVL
ncbi:MAG: bifunctional phosphoserine phosphatase/homoserine phosphotransferase ThrH [Spirochaetales bacterium]|jgi:phosphoserine/homoserine phosphotransferase|nr:bifunctional phosphoserine phosphatase/homoserine phosphotransferase ThrH [Spirochaetales bacterium]